MTKRDIIWVGCQQGHDWESLGGRNACCHKECSCSVPVHRCKRCGECDYGENAEAEATRAACHEQHGTPEMFDYVDA